jgi:putative radical SAM enzyme (TIGR03279 family)
VAKYNAEIENVLPGSIAQQLELEPGDKILSVNGSKPEDLIDFRFLCADEEIEIEIMKEDGQIWVCDVQKEFDEALGITFTQDTFDGIRNCANKCIFCFVDQMPVGLRESLYIKDDDYRHSFLHGNFITLTNLTKNDIDRILRMRLSPLYISVHTTNPVLREKMLGSKKAGSIMNQLKELASAGLEMHTQIVLCPGLNDGEELTRTVDDLTSLWPSVRSIAIVPVGITGYQKNIDLIRPFTSIEAQELIEVLIPVQDNLRKKTKIPCLFLADEFFVLAGHSIPKTNYYGDFPQLENGVGLVRIFYDSFEKEIKALPKSFKVTKKIAVVTGKSGEYVLEPLIKKLNTINNLHIKLIGVQNVFFGGHVTVSGLLTGSDILNEIKTLVGYDTVLIPGVMLKKGEDVFLDGKTVQDLEEKLGAKVIVIDIENGAKDFIRIIRD